MFPYPAPSPRFPRPARINCQKLDPGRQVWAEGYEVGYIDQCSIMVTIYPNLHWALTASSITLLTSLTYILFVNFVSILVLLSHLTVTGRSILRLVVVSRLDLVSRTFARAIPPLYMHRPILIHYDLFIEFETKLTCSKINTWIAIERNISSKQAVPLHQEKWPYTMHNSYRSCFWAGNSWHIWHMALRGAMDVQSD